jgi:hypothetical protein
VAGKGGSDTKHFPLITNRISLWTILFFCLLVSLSCFIMTLLPRPLVFLVLMVTTCLYYNEVLWGAGVRIAANVKTKYDIVTGQPPQSVENGISDSGSEVGGRETANFRGQKPIALGSQPYVKFEGNQSQLLYVKKTASQIRQKQLEFAANDLLFDGEIIDLTHDPYGEGMEVKGGADTPFEQHSQAPKVSLPDLGSFPPNFRSPS